MPLGHPVIRGQRAAERQSARRTAPQQRIIWLKMSVVPRLRNPALGPWLSISSRCQNPLKDLLKHRSSGPTFWASDWTGPGPENLHWWWTLKWCLFCCSGEPWFENHWPRTSWQDSGSQVSGRRHSNFCLSSLWAEVGTNDKWPEKAHPGWEEPRVVML